MTDNHTQIVMSECPTIQKPDTLLQVEPVNLLTFNVL